MENIMMPSNYLVLNEEEMTYTEGGATAVQAICAWVVPFYGWWKGITAVRDYRRAHPDNWIDTGMDAYTSHLDNADVPTMLYDIACGISVVSTTVSLFWLPINAIVVFS